MTKHEELISKEINATTRWGIGLLIALALQTAGLTYWFGSWSTGLEARVERNSELIESAQTLEGAANFVYRLEQLEVAVKDNNEVVGKLDERLRQKGI